MSPDGAPGFKRGERLRWRRSESCGDRRVTGAILQISSTTLGCGPKVVCFRAVAETTSTDMTLKWPVTWVTENTVSHGKRRRYGISSPALKSASEPPSTPSPAPASCSLYPPASSSQRRWINSPARSQTPFNSSSETQRPPRRRLCRPVLACSESAPPPATPGTDAAGRPPQATNRTPKSTPLSATIACQAISVVASRHKTHQLRFVASRLVFSPAVVHRRCHGNSRQLAANMS